MATTLGTTSITHNDGTTQSSSTGVARCWVRFFGSDGSTVVSFNISSVVRNGVGNYSINFSSALSDSNYIVTTGVSSGTIGSGDNVQGSSRFYTTSSSAVQVATILGNGTAFTDGGQITIAILR